MKASRPRSVPDATEPQHRVNDALKPVSSARNGMDASARAGDTPALNVRCHLGPQPVGPTGRATGLTRREVPPIEPAPVWPAESA
jgi:hypothetical protein